MFKKIFYAILVTGLFACNSADDWQDSAYINEKSKVQKHIPAIQQFKPFVNRMETERVGMFVKEKLEQERFPPSISVGELDSLGISY